MAHTMSTLPPFPFQVYSQLLEQFGAVQQGCCLFECCLVDDTGHQGLRQKQCLAAQKAKRAGDLDEGQRQRHQSQRLYAPGPRLNPRLSFRLTVHSRAFV